jgi:hypothetical protein
MHREIVPLSPALGPLWAVLSLPLILSVCVCVWEGAHRDTLMSATFRDYLLTHRVLLWAGDVREADAARVCERLQVASFPFLALVDQSTTPTRVVPLEGTDRPAPPPPPCPCVAL